LATTTSLKQNEGVKCKIVEWGNKQTMFRVTCGVQLQIASLLFEGNISNALLFVKTGNFVGLNWRGSLCVKI